MTEEEKIARKWRKALGLPVEVAIEGNNLLLDGGVALSVPEPILKAEHVQGELLISTKNAIYRVGHFGEIITGDSKVMKAWT